MNKYIILVHDTSTCATMAIKWNKGNNKKTLTKKSLKDISWCKLTFTHQYCIQLSAKFRLVCSVPVRTYQEVMKVAQTRTMNAKRHLLSALFNANDGAIHHIFCITILLILLNVLQCTKVIIKLQRSEIDKWREKKK